MKTDETFHDKNEIKLANNQFENNITKLIDYLT